MKNTRRETIGGRYVHIPVKGIGEAAASLWFLPWMNGAAARFNYVPATSADCDFVAAIDLGENFGGELRVESDSGLLCRSFSFAATPPETGAKNEPLRQQFHFSPFRGWLNDPNGLGFFGGKYQMFYQYNPFGVTWSNMHWGRAESDDLVHWRETGVFLRPEAFGAPYSGGVVIDHRNDSGLGDGKEPPVLMYFTAAGDHVEPKQPYTQRLLYSTDGGATFRDYDRNPVIGSLVDDGERDPSIVWDETGGIWRMGLYCGDKDREFRFFKSSNLIDWRETGRFRDDIGRECPELFTLRDEKDGKAYMVLLTATGHYWVGTFIDDRFVPGPRQLLAARFGNFYAAQTFKNTGDRRILLGWQPCEVRDRRFSQSMTLPLELTLKDGVIKVAPVREIESRRGAEFDVLPLAEGQCWELEIVSLDSGAALLDVCGEKVLLDVDAGEIRVGVAKLDGLARPLRCRIFADRQTIEVFADGKYLSKQKSAAADGVRPAECWSPDCRLARLRAWEIK
ncbi:MAG: glycoside hydrolase family 32 protein [Victivallaceae bacterium]